jgi:hypothetical protein
MNSCPQPGQTTCFPRSALRPERFSWQEAFGQVVFMIRGRAGNADRFNRPVPTGQVLLATTPPTGLETFDRDLTHPAGGSVNLVVL